MCHEGTFVWQNPIRTINALLWFLAICRVKSENCWTIKASVGSQDVFRGCVHVRTCLCAVMHLSFPRINRRLRITFLQVQTNSMSANYCQILPLLSDSLTGSTVIFFFFVVVSLSDMNVFLKVWNWCLAEDWKCPPLLHPGQKYNYTSPELWDMLLHSHTAYARWIRREFCIIASDHVHIFIRQVF